MKRFFGLGFLMVIWGISQVAYAQCYLTVENPGNLDTKAISQISLIQISQHFETVNEIPPEGIGNDACTYNLSVAEIANGILVTIKGRKVSTYGDSKLRGFDGFQQALFRAIISAKPEQRDPICRRYHALMGSDCSDVAAPAPSPAVVKGKLIVRVPVDHRYAQIFSSNRLLGEMGGETIKEFEVEMNATLYLSAKDGGFTSEDLYVMAQPNQPARADFNTFTSAEAPIPTAKVVATPVVQESMEKDFGEDNPFIFGFSLMPFEFAGDDDFRKESRDGSYQAEAITSAIGVGMFAEYFLGQNLGLGLKYLSTTAGRETEDKRYKQEVVNSMFMVTATLWFPLSTKNHGYSHFGLTGGTGSATYTITAKKDGEVVEEYESLGSATLFGAFFDWGGDVFGVRLGFQSISTDYGEVENKITGKVFEADLDGSGSGAYLTLRWGFQ